MSTERQIKANKANASKSTGPGPRGKPISSRNAVKHGLFSKQRQVPEEDRPVIRQLEQQLYAEYRPQGPTETAYIDSIVDNIARLSTTLKIEKNLFEHYRVYDDRKGDVSVAFAHDASQTNSLTRLSRYARIFERGLQKDLAELRKLQARRSRPAAPSPDPVTAAGPDGQCLNGPAPDSGRPLQEPAATGATPSPATQPAAVPPPTGVAPLGVFTDHILLADESRPKFNAHLQALSDEWQPATTIKALFVELFAAIYWRRARLSRVAAGLFEQYGPGGKLLTAFVEDAIQNDCFTKLGAYETLLRDSQSKVLKELLA
jgi:hypothetical protein